MKRNYLKVLSMLICIFLLVSCDKEREIATSPVNQSLNTENEVLIENANTITVDGENVTLDDQNLLYLDSNVIVENEEIFSTTKENVWYIPFNLSEDALPIMIRSARNDPHTTISCACDPGGCSVQGTQSGNSTTYRCKGSCNGGSCTMTVVVTPKPVEVINPNPEPIFIHLLDDTSGFLVSLDLENSQNVFDLYKDQIADIASYYRNMK